MNTKGYALVNVIFYSLIFVILWALFFAPQLSTWGHAAVVNGGLTGVEAMFYENLNFLIGIIFGLFVLAFALFGGGE